MPTLWNNQISVKNDLQTWALIHLKGLCVRFKGSFLVVKVKYLLTGYTTQMRSRTCLQEQCGLIWTGGGVPASWGSTSRFPAALHSCHRSVSAPQHTSTTETLHFVVHSFQLGWPFESLKGAMEDLEIKGQKRENGMQISLTPYLDKKINYDI